MTKIYDWEAIRADYIETSLAHAKTPVVYFTNKYGMKYHTFVAKRKALNWDKDVKIERRKLEKQTLKKLRTRLSNTDVEDTLDELSVRKKNMELANIVLETLVEEWAKKIQNPKERKKLSLSALMSGIDMVSRLRGKAAGLPEKLDINSKNLNLNVDADSSHLSPAENRKKVQESEQLAHSLKSLLKEFEVVDVKAVRPKKSKAQKALKGKRGN